MLHRLRRRPSPSMVIALLALFVALGGPAAAARLIDGSLIRRNSITSKQIRNRTIGVQDVSRRAIKILQATPNGSITAAKLAPNAVGSPALADKGVAAVDLADNAVGPAQLAPGAVTASRLADGAVGAAAVADGGLQTRDIGDFYGFVSVDFDAFRANVCQVAKDIAPQPSAPNQGNVIADDVIAVSPAAGWPDPIVVTANPGAGNTMRIVACRVGGNPADAADVIDPPATVFQYVAFDEP